MNTRLKTLIRAQIATTVLLLSCGAAHAESACAPPVSGPYAERIHEEAARGMPSFVRFIRRTHAVYQLDVATEVAKRDAEAHATLACEARVASAGSSLPVVDDRAATSGR